MSGETDAEKGLAEAVEKFFKDLAAGICPHCQEKMDDQEQVGRCIYARPCGHRLGRV